MLTSRYLSRYVTFYDEHIRKHSASEKLGVIRQIRNLLNQGITEEQIQRALQNYADDPFRKSGDQRFSKNIRSFFNSVNILQWQEPMKRSRRPDAPSSPEPLFVPTPRPVIGHDEPVEIGL